MNTEKINTFFNEIILDKFILNFVPGLILFFVVSSFVEFSISAGLSAFLIITSVSWVLGILLEMIFFRKVYLSRREGKAYNVSETLNLLYGKLGISILITFVSWINIRAILFNTYNGRVDKSEVFFIIVKFLIVALVGLFLYLYYLKSRIKEE